MTTEFLSADNTKTGLEYTIKNSTKPSYTKDSGKPVLSPNGVTHLQQKHEPIYQSHADQWIQE